MSDEKKTLTELPGLGMFIAGSALVFVALLALVVAAFVHDVLTAQHVLLACWAQIVGLALILAGIAAGAKGRRET